MCLLLTQSVLVLPFNQVIAHRPPITVLRAATQIPFGLSHKRYMIFGWHARVRLIRVSFIFNAT